MRRRWQVWLVARREIIERGRSRGFILSLLLTAALIVGGFVLPTVLIGDEDELRIGLPATTPAAVGSALVAAGAPFGATVELAEFDDREAAVAALEGEQVEAVVLVPADLSGPGELVVRESADDMLQAIVGSAIVAVRTEAVLGEAGIEPGTVASAAQPPEVVALEPQSQEERDAFLVANVGVVLMFAAILSFAFTVLTGIVEEKQSRVVEVVLSSVRPRDVLAGKVLGIGLLGLVQLLVFLVAGIAAIALVGPFTLPATTLPAILQLLLWFGLGYALYATMLGFLGSLASRMEEASNVSTPVTMLLVGSYVVVFILVGEDPDSLAAVVLSLVPFTAPMAVPLRAALDAISLAEVGLAIALTAAAIWLLFELGGRVYTGAVLETAGRVRLRDAWRRAGRE